MHDSAMQVIVASIDSRNDAVSCATSDSLSERSNMNGFENVAPALGQALGKRGYSDLTPVQLAVLAAGLGDADLLVSAQTGSGKTVAFGLAIAPTLLDGADRFAHPTAPLALVIAPTRELALQVKRELEWLYEATGAVVASCVGGMDMRTERRTLNRGAHIVVGTPGRLRDHIERGSFDTSGLRAVVLDEADEMLDLGFRDDLEYILGTSPAERRTLMFSATVPRSITALAATYQRDAVRISTTAEQKQHLDIEYRALVCSPADQENAVINVLRYFEAKNALVFCATRATVNHMTSRLSNRGFSVVALSGELSQNERTHALQAMRDGRARVCVATDVAARGIDLPDLELVIHADLPRNREGLVHRSGRTGRAGRKGVSALIVPHNARKRTERLLHSAQIEAEWASPPSFEDIMQRDDERILSDPALTAAIDENEMPFAQALLARHGAEQVAAALIRLYRASRSAPEELLDAAPAPVVKKQRDDFKGSVWFSLSVGRKASAEPRWLLPLLCRAGHLTKRDIGAIRIHPDDTHVELAPDCVARFVDALGPDRTLEKTIIVTRLDGAPAAQAGTRDDTMPNRTRSASPRSGPRADPEPKRKWAPKSGDDFAVEKLPNAVSSKPKKPRKPKFANSGAKDQGPRKPTSAVARSRGKTKIK
jgi:ATP-dependent RNA helicase DeaD